MSWSIVRVVSAYSRLVLQSSGRHRTLVTTNAAGETKGLEGGSCATKGTFRGYTFLALILGYMGFKVADLTISDDWDTRFMDKFRVPLNMASQMDRPNLVVLGTGWSSMYFLRKLHTDQYNVTVVSPRNYFLFTPLLPSTTSGLLKFDSITTPIYEFATSLIWGRCKFVQMSATQIDYKNKKVYCQDLTDTPNEIKQTVLDYDYLVLGVGAQPCDFGIPGVENNAHYFKSLKDARGLRSHIISNFERANYPGQRESEVERLLHVVVVGGGPTGVELASEINDFIRRDLLIPYSSIASKAKVTIVEALPNLLSMLSPSMVKYAEDRLVSGKIQLLKNYVVNSVQSQKLQIKNRDGTDTTELDYGVLVWATGNSVPKVIKQMAEEIGAPNQNSPRGVEVDDHMLVCGTDDVFAIGDNAVFERLPATAQVASQEGSYLARLFNKNSEAMNAWSKGVYRTKATSSDPLGLSLQDKMNLNDTDQLGITDRPWSDFEPFKFHYKGTITSVGRLDSLFDSGGYVKFEGVVAYFTARAVYWLKYPAIRNRIKLLSDYFVSDTLGGTNSNFN